MKFGVTIPRSLMDVGSHDPYGRIYDHVREAEDLGFEFAAIGQHRFSPELAFGEPSAPFVMLAAILARTRRIKMCTSIVLLATYHPLDVAEQVNTLAQLSGGRFICGVGLGYRAYEFEAVEIDFKRRAGRFDEGLQVLDRALTGEKFSFEGKHFHIRDVQVTPPPPPGKRTPVWMGANSEVGIARAANRTDGWIVGFPEFIDDLAPRAALYRSLAAEAGRPSTLCLMRDFHIAETREAMDPEWLPRSIAVNQRYQKAGSSARRDPVSLRLLAGEAVGLDEFVPGRAIAGDPDDCIREIARCRDLTGCEYMMLVPVGVPSPEQQMRELRLFSKVVMPAFAD